MKHSYKGDGALSPGIWVVPCFMQQRYPSPFRKYWPAAVHRGVPNKQEKRKKEKRFLSSSSVVAKGTQSTFLCCDWIIILLLIHVVYVFSVDSFQRGKELRAIQQGRINPMKASQRSPSEQAGRRASRQIQGNATATGRAVQSHMAPGQTGRESNHLFSQESSPLPSSHPSLFCIS